MRNFRLLTLVSALVFVGSGITSPVMTIYLESLGASLAEISLILTSFMLTALVANYVVGRVSDRLGARKALLVAGLLLLAIAYFWLARVASAGMAWPVRIVEGIGSGAYGTLSLAMMGDILERSGRRGQRMGFFRGIGSVSFAIGAFSGGWFATQFSRPGAFLLAACCYLAAALAALLVYEPRRSPAAALPEPAPQALAPVEPEVAPAPESALELPSEPAAEPPAEPPAEQAVAPAAELAGAPSGYPLRGLGLPMRFLAGVLLWTAAIGVLSAMWPNAMGHQGYSQQTISSLWGLAALIEMPGMQGAGYLSDAFGRAPLLAVGAFGITLVCIGYALFARWLPALLGVQVLRGLSYGSYTGTAMTFAAEHGDRRTRGSVSGVFTAASGGGQMLGTLAGGFIAQAFGFTIMFALSSTLAAIAGIFFISLHCKEAQERRAQPATPEPADSAALGR